ncbi:cation:proton antiporter [Homoserinibacter sp. YIM 151385]|uniref:cation:proton antiporter n=1 Tax=Homoserinibacter sp. YIM 151385 TaxID=2985506 RepID=UPI0022EFD8AE|nr:cation:proton antiporter [Homoserinibacter sp. YIM 151385]WBU39157.1 cation:proton antiporter [Homoserinibacter sp. YIM 151385]
MLEYALIGVAAIVIIVAVSALSARIRIAAPLALVVVGIGISWIPGVPPVEVEPDWILLLLLPPLLYSAAVTVPIVDFRRNLSTITGLSVTLVLVSALLTGFTLSALLPDLELWAAIALGAVISPTDVVAATSIGKRLGLPSRLLTILEGEGLVNDATALVLLRTAIAAGAVTASGELDLGGTVLDFLWAVAAAAVVGIAVGWLAIVVRRRLDDAILQSVVSFAVPFIAFLPAEELGASGVIAVVAAGLYAGNAAPAALGVQSRLTDRLNWRTVQFVLEHGVFLLMGLELKGIVEGIGGDELSVGGSVLIGLLLAVILVATRFGFTGPLVALLRRRESQAGDFEERVGLIERRLDELEGDERMARRVAGARRRIDQRSNDISLLRAEGLDWRGGVVISWAGMRGVVTLAAAQTLPADTPYSEQLVLIAFTVAIATLLLQGATLPAVIRASGVRGSDAQLDRRALAELLDEINEAGIERLDAVAAAENAPPTEVVEQVRDAIRLAAEAAWEEAEHGENPEKLARSPHEQFRTLRSEVLAAERAALLDARARGAYASRILARVQVILDLEESRLGRPDADGH